MASSVFGQSINSLSADAGSVVGDPLVVPMTDQVEGQKPTTFRCALMLEFKV